MTRALLRVLELVYTAVVRARNRAYDSGRGKVIAVEVPVISVGNLTLGGTGKTPTVEWLARWFVERGVRVGLASRGYGAREGHANDEALELAEKLPSVPHVLDPDRVAGVRRLIREFGCRLALLDDGFQHRRIGRDLDVVLVDALEPFGFGHVFPRGTLREPLGGWSRAQVVMLSRADLVDETERTAIRQRVRYHAPLAAWIETAYRPRCLQSPSGHEKEIAQYVGEPIAAFCGIGNPDAFEAALAGCGFMLRGMRRFPDHFRYSAADALNLAMWCNELGVSAVVCTSKDLVKIGPLWSADQPLWALKSELNITHGETELVAALQPIFVRAQAVC